MPEHYDISYDVLVTLRRIIRAIDMHSKRLGKEYGLTGPQLMILKEIRSGTDITIGHVAKKVSLSQATVTNIIDRLEKRGMVTRERSTLDKRRVIVRTTDKAEEILKTNPSVLQADFINSFQTLETWEQNLILSSLQRIAAMMGAEHISFPEEEVGQFI
ncbi:MarR family winged helix-turn-helix transcriptional regulator [Sediminispirochaeta bajacaliforniensis]|uniref:MarR family winged helix-turn-helix transcriptional regulator n=1 Tax=Sediminispirochaeta bajacaliforniensis TaxID=148 RepID=UPI000378414D|nr:MarR family transcriptional regulator [Sediminispirochaeta bajacaliforniensis]